MAACSTSDFFRWISACARTAQSFIRPRTFTAISPTPPWSRFAACPGGAVASLLATGRGAAAHVARATDIARTLAARPVSVCVGECREMLFVKPHDRELRFFLGRQALVKKRARDVLPPEIPVQRLAAQIESVTRELSHQRPPHAAAASNLTNVKISDPKTPAPRMCLEPLACDGIADERALQLRDETIEPALGTRAVAQQL